MPPVELHMPTCAHCGARAVVSWQRRPTETELAPFAAAVQERNAELLLLADPERPAPQLPPLPTADTTTIAVYACAQHAIDMNLAASVHGADCVAPHPDHLPRCACTPEQPAPAHDPALDLITLPTGWTVPSPARSTA